MQVLVLCRSLPACFGWGGVGWGGAEGGGRELWTNAAVRHMGRLQERERCGKPLKKRSIFLTKLPSCSGWALVTSRGGCGKRLWGWPGRLWQGSGKSCAKSLGGSSKEGSGELEAGFGKGGGVGWGSLEFRL